MPGEIVKLAALSDGGTPRQQSLAGLACVAGRIAKGQAQGVGVGKLPAKIPRRRDIAEIVAEPLSVGRKIIRRRRVIELAEQTAKLSVTMARAECPAISLNCYLRHFRRAAMRENLYHAVHRVRAIQ